MQFPVCCQLKDFNLSRHTFLSWRSLTRYVVLTNGLHLVHSQELTYCKTEIIIIIIHQTHYEKSDWSRAFNQFTIACELDMINVISAADITFIMSSSTSAWLLSPLECSPQKQNG